MPKKLFCLSLLFAWMIPYGSSSSQAVSITLEPLAQNILIGSHADVAVRISGLGTPPGNSGTSPSLSTYDLDIGFNPGILAFSGATLGDPGLGNQLDLFNLGNNPASVTSGAGKVNIFELSPDLPADLVALQAKDFILAILSFDTISLGTSALGVVVNALGDEVGAPLSPSVFGAAVTVTPEPGTIVLLGTVMLVGLGYGWRRPVPPPRPGTASPPGEPRPLPPKSSWARRGHRLSDTLTVGTTG
jgi:hypothetical protein